MIVKFIMWVESSFIQALAGELEYNICVLNLAERYLSDDRLNMLLSIVPQRSIILLEDVDAAFASDRSKATGADANALTFSGFLNALDGVVSSEGRIVFMTTNHIDRLDPAILRPGRVDVKVYVGNATEHQIRLMFLRFYEGEVELANEFIRKLGDTAVSTAQLQGLFLFCKNNPRQAIEQIGWLKSSETPKPESSRRQIDIQ
jgi:chaperone BCS1